MYRVPVRFIICLITISAHYFCIKRQRHCALRQHLFFCKLMFVDHKFCACVWCVCAIYLSIMLVKKSGMFIVAPDPPLCTPKERKNWINNKAKHTMYSVFALHYTLCALLLFMFWFYCSWLSWNCVCVCELVRCSLNWWHRLMVKFIKQT